MIEKFMNEKKEEIIKNLQCLIQIPSVYEQSNNPKYPFGENINRFNLYRKAIVIDSKKYNIKNFEGIKITNFANENKKLKTLVCKWI